MMGRSLSLSSMQSSRCCKETLDSRSQAWLQENMSTGVKFSPWVWEETLNTGEKEDIWDKRFFQEKRGLDGQPLFRGYLTLEE